MDNCTKIIDNCLVMIVILLSGLILVGCGSHVPKNWTFTQQNDKVVWADDGSDVAVVVLSFEEKRGGLLSSTTKRNLKHKILVQNLDGSGQRTIVQWRDYQSGQIFYMKQAGYLVVESLLENGTRRFDKIELNGNWIPIVEETMAYEPCKNNASSGANTSLPAQIDHSVIPSPDGAFIVEIYSPECGKVTVEFLHANNSYIVDSQTMDIDKPMKATWHPDGYVILATYSNDKAWKITPLAPHAPINPPNCLSPVTISSDVSWDGKMVYFEGDKLVTKEVGRHKAFGCQ